jgi:hypothetical protein
MKRSEVQTAVVRLGDALGQTIDEVFGEGAGYVLQIILPDEPTKTHTVSNIPREDVIRMWNEEINNMADVKVFDLKTTPIEEIHEAIAEALGEKKH